MSECRRFRKMSVILISCPCTPILLTTSKDKLNYYSTLNYTVWLQLLLIRYIVAIQKKHNNKFKNTWAYLRSLERNKIRIYIHLNVSSSPAVVIPRNWLLHSFLPSTINTLSTFKQHNHYFRIRLYFFDCSQWSSSIACNSSYKSSTFMDSWLSRQATPNALCTGH